MGHRPSCVLVVSMNFRISAGRGLLRSGQRESCERRSARPSSEYVGGWSDWGGRVVGRSGGLGGMITRPLGLTMRSNSTGATSAGESRIQSGARARAC
eukprot:7196976-Prymnesium_polylepis.1